MGLEAASERIQQLSELVALSPGKVAITLNEFSN